MPKPDAGGLRSDGTPRRPNHRDKPLAVRATGASSSGRPASTRTGAGAGAGSAGGSGGRSASADRDTRPAPKADKRLAGASRAAADPRRGAGDSSRGAAGVSRGSADLKRAVGSKRGTDPKRSVGSTAYASRAEARSATGGGRRPASSGSAGMLAGARGSAASTARQPTRAAGGPRVATIGGTGSGGKGGSDRPVKAAPRRKALPTADVPIRKPRSAATGTAGTKGPGTKAAGTKKKPRPAPEDLERLQKVLATAGIGSRRVCEDMIAAGRVRVDGDIAELGDKVDPVNSEIYVDGERVITDAKRVYLAINKPAGVVSTMSDEKGREALADYLGNVPQRVYHVGRLDADSEGLLLMTNDGTLAHKLTHPSYGVPKTYLAEVPGPIKGNVRQRLLDGIELDDGPARADGFRVVDSLGKRVLVEIVLHEGRKHIVRRMLAEIGYPVSRLVRTSIGPIKLGDLKMGRTRRLTRGEIAALFKAVEDDDADEYEDLTDE